MTLNQIIADVVTGIPQKRYEVLSNGWQACLAAGIFCGAFLGDRLPLLLYITIAIVFDAMWGINTAKKAKKFILSKLFTKSAIKIGAYFSVYALVALIEKGFTNGDFMVSSSIIAAILITSELWSILGHIAIAHPDFLVVKLLKRYLKGEMSKKLGIPETELDDMLNNKDKQNNNEENSSNT